MSGFSGQGKIRIGSRLASGHPGLMRWIGNASVATLQLEEDSEQRNESYTGNRQPLRSLTRSRKGTLMLKFDEFSVDNLAFLQAASITQVAAASPVNGYTFPSGAKVGDLLTVPAKNLSAFLLYDSAATAATLSGGTHFKLHTLAGGAELLSLGSFTQPFKANYTGGEYTKIGALNQASVDRYVQFEGINTDDSAGRAGIVVDIFRCRFKLLKQFELIGDTIHDFEIEATVLMDPTKDPDGADGQFYTINQLS